MKIIVKTLKKEEFTFDINGDQTVADLKALIEQSQGHAVSHQKLIFSGKILPNDSTLSASGVQEGQFIVLMVSKRKRRAKKTQQPKAEPKTVTPSTTTTTTTTTTTDNNAQETKKDTTTTTTSTTTSSDMSDDKQDDNSTTTTTTSTTTPSTTATPTTTTASGNNNNSGLDAVFEEKVKQLMNMGFSRDLSIQCLRAAFEDVGRAIEYCVGGIPDSALSLLTGGGGGGGVMPQTTNTITPSTPTSQATTPTNTTAQAPTSTNTTTTTDNNSGGGGGGGGSLWQQAAEQANNQAGQGGADPLAFIRNHPNLNEIRMAIRQNPNILPVILQQFAMHYPQIYEAISQNQQEFVQIINQQPTGGAGAGAGAGGAGGIPGQQQNVVYLNPTDKTAIEKLQALGFSEQRCVEAYLAFEKNENAAANFLLENAFEDDTNAAMQQSMTDDNNTTNTNTDTTASTNDDSNNNTDTNNNDDSNNDTTSQNN